MTEKLFTGTLNHNKNKKQRLFISVSYGIYVEFISYHFMTDDRILVHGDTLTHLRNYTVILITVKMRLFG